MATERRDALAMARGKRMKESLLVRCRSLLASLSSFPPPKLASSPRSRLAKLLRSELRFLLRTDPDSHRVRLSSTNLGYLDSIIQVLQHPLVEAASAVLQTFRTFQSTKYKFETETTEVKENSKEGVEAHVDIVCTFEGRPVWFIISDRNPNYLFWLDETGGRKGLRTRVQVTLKAALANSVLQPAAILLCFAKGIQTSVGERLEKEFGAWRVKSFECDIAKQSSRHSSFKPIYMFHEVEGGEWVDIQIGLDQMDCFFVGEGGIHTEACAVTDKGQVDGVSCQDWATFQMDIQSFVDRVQGSCESDFPLVNELERCTLAGKELDIQKNSNDILLQLSDQETRNVYTLQQSWESRRLKRFPDCIDQACSYFNELLVTLSSHDGLFTNEEDCLSLKSNLLNLDTTTLVALVSEVSNGCAQILVSISEEELRRRFGNTADFMRGQAGSELEKPLLPEMISFMTQRRPFISQFACDEFKSLISMCGGVQEKRRADMLLKLLPVLPNRPSTRMMDLTESGKIKEKNKIVFGTGDSWHASTLTANTAFVRAVRQTGMAFAIIEHRPRALVGDKCTC